MKLQQDISVALDSLSLVVVGLQMEFFKEA